MDLSLFDLRGKKALVTGGATGIGRAAAFALAQGGADVAIVDLNEEVGNKTVAAIEAMGRESIFVRCDVADADSVRTMIETIVRRFGRLDIAVNNAGIIRFEPDGLSTWMVPLERSVPPRVDAAGEIIETNKDLDARGVPHDDDGIILK